MHVHIPDWHDVLQKLLGAAAFVGLCWLLWRFHVRDTRRAAELEVFRAERLAPRLGMRVVEGDPMVNLLTGLQDHRRNLSFTPIGYAGQIWSPRSFNRSARLAGRPFAHPMELRYVLQGRLEHHFRSTTVQTEFECSLSVQVEAHVPPFEVVHRWRFRRPVPERALRAPRRTFGEARLDSALRLFTPEAAVGPVLAPHLTELPALPWVHIVGGAQTVHVLATREGAPLLIAHIEAWLRVLERLACALEGRPVPALPTGPLTPPAT